MHDVGPLQNILVFNTSTSVPESAIQRKNVGESYNWIQGRHGGKENQNKS